MPDYKKFKDGDRLAHEKVGQALATIYQMCFEKRRGVRRWHKINIRLGDDATIETLITVTMSDEDGDWVGFHKGIDPVAALRGCLNRCKNGSMKWKEDEYAKQTDSRAD